MKSISSAALRIGVFVLGIMTMQSCARYKLEAPQIQIGNNSMSPANVRMAIEPGATAYYSLSGTNPTVRFDPDNPLVLYDNATVRAVQKMTGYVDSDVASQDFVVRHVIAGPETHFRAPGGPQGSWTTTGNGYKFTLVTVTGNGTRMDDNTQVKLVIQYSGIIDSDWSGTTDPGNIALSSAVSSDGTATLIFGDGSTTLFSQTGQAPTGIYEFNVEVGNKKFMVVLPAVFLPSWSNPDQ